MTQPTAEQLEVTQADREAAASTQDHFPLTAKVIRAGKHDHTQLVQAFARHRQATEARMAAAVEADVEKIARIIDPSSWAVMDGYLSDMLRKYKGQNIGYDPDAFKHKQSMATARALLPIIRAHLEPTSEMVEAVMDCGPIGCCNISSTEARDIILSALKASPIGDVG